MVGFVALLGAYVTTGQIIPGIFQYPTNRFYKLLVQALIFNSFKRKIRSYFKFENKKNQTKVMAFKLNIIPRNI